MKNRIWPALFAALALAGGIAYTIWLTQAIRDHSWGWATLYACLVAVAAGALSDSIRDLRKASR